MIYLNESDIRSLGIDWPRLIDVVAEAARSVHGGDYAQPLKPFMRMPNPANFFLALPAFVGGGVGSAGVKWTGSFPANTFRGRYRASSVTLLSEPDSGRPLALINSPLLHVLRAVAVSGFLLQYFEQIRPLPRLHLGFSGWGRVGRFHACLCHTLFGERIERFVVYDPLGVSSDSTVFLPPERVVAARTWQEAYMQADLFFACTVSSTPYIDLPPRSGSLHMDVSLHDYTPGLLPYFRGGVVVDDWQEVCREGSDIERMHREMELNRQDCLPLIATVLENRLARLPANQPILYCGMGLAVFDIALAAHYLQLAIARQVGRHLR